VNGHWYSTEPAELTIQAERDRVLQNLDRERARAARLEEEPRRSQRGFWKRLFG
jgi:hypothetical protein